MTLGAGTGEDLFAKVKGLVTDIIKKLQAEASPEASKAEELKAVADATQAARKITTYWQGQQRDRPTPRRVQRCSPSRVAQAVPWVPTCTVEQGFRESEGGRGGIHNIIGCWEMLLRRRRRVGSCGGVAEVFASEWLPITRLP